MTRRAVWAACALAAVSASSLAWVASGPGGSAAERERVWESHAAAVRERGIAPLVLDRLRFIQGRIVDRDTGYVEGARVWLVDALRVPTDGPRDAVAEVPTDAVEDETTTDAGGEFRFRGYRPGPKRLYAQAPDGRHGMFRLPGAGEGIPCRGCRIEVGPPQRAESDPGDAAATAVGSVAWPAAAEPPCVAAGAPVWRFREPSRLARTASGALVRRDAQGRLGPPETDASAALPLQIDGVGPRAGTVRALVPGRSIPATPSELDVVRDGSGCEVVGAPAWAERLVVVGPGTCGVASRQPGPDGATEYRAELLPDDVVRVTAPAQTDGGDPPEWRLATRVRVLDAALPGPATWLEPGPPLEPDGGAFEARRSAWLLADGVLELRPGRHPVVHRMEPTGEGFRLVGPGGDAAHRIEIHTLWAHQQATVVDDLGGRSVVRAGLDRRAVVEGVAGGLPCLVWLEDDPQGDTWYAPRGVRPAPGRESRVVFSIADENSGYASRGAVHGFIDPFPRIAEATVYLSPADQPFSIRTARPSEDGHFSFPRPAPGVRYHVVLVPAPSPDAPVPVEAAKTVVLGPAVPPSGWMRIDIPFGTSSVVLPADSAGGARRLDLRTATDAPDPWLARWAGSDGGPRRIDNLSAGEYRIVRTGARGAADLVVASFVVSGGECLDLREPAQGREHPARGAGR